MDDFQIMSIFGSDFGKIYKESCLLLLQESYNDSRWIEWILSKWYIHIKYEGVDSDIWLLYLMHALLRLEELLKILQLDLWTRSFLLKYSR